MPEEEQFSDSGDLIDFEILDTPVSDDKKQKERDEDDEEKPEADE